MDEAAPQRLAHRFGAIGHPELPKQALEVRLDGVLGHPEHLAEFAIVHAFAEQLENLVFAAGQPRPRFAFVQAGGHAVGQIPSAGVDFANRVNEFVFDDALEELAQRAGGEGLPDVFVAVVV